MVRIGVAALAVVMVAMNWRLLTGQFSEQAIIIAAFSVPGLVLLVAWLKRLLQTSRAAQAQAEQVSVTPCLARGRVATGGMFGPVTQSLWMVIGAGKSRRYQRVAWEPWVAQLQGAVQAEMRAGSEPVAVLDVAGHGRLWPASRLLSEAPANVELTEFPSATSPTTRGNAIYRVVLLIAMFLVPCVFIGSLWGIAYLATFVFAVWLWFGLTPLGWKPGSGQGD
jgi:membrane protein implicated in regulation of membrane protease activity